MISIKVTVPGRYSFGPKGEKTTEEEPGVIELSYEEPDVGTKDPAFLIAVWTDGNSAPRQLALSESEFHAFRLAFVKGWVKRD